MKLKMSWGTSLPGKIVMGAGLAAILGSSIALATITKRNYAAMDMIQHLDTANSYIKQGNFREAEKWLTEAEDCARKARADTRYIHSLRKNLSEHYLI